MQSFTSLLKRVQNLLEELEALYIELGSLTHTVRTEVRIDLLVFEAPLQRCGSACREFKQILLRCSSQSGINRTSFCGWAKLTYMGDDIDGFRQLLSSYKSTIDIALTDVDMLL